MNGYADSIEAHWTTLACYCGPGLLFVLGGGLVGARNACEF